MPDQFIDYTLNSKTYAATQDAVAFIKEHKLTNGVVEIIARMREYLTSMEDIQVVVFQDPDCDCDPELILRAIFPDSITDDAIDGEMDRFDEGWWLDNSQRWNFQIEVQAGSLA